jgi:CBS domain containing-hemolysin-like protein
VYVARATTPIEEMAQRLGLVLPEGDYETLAGFLLHELGRIPVRGESVTWHDVEFEILTADRRRIESVQVTLGGSRVKTPARP